MNSKLKRCIKSEADVEFFACVHAISMVFLFGFELYLYGIKEVPFVIIFEMFLLSYLISWMQKLLFLKEKIYSSQEFTIRAILWSVGPVIVTVLSGRIFDWYSGYPEWIEVVFVVIMLIYYVMIWGALQILYKDETNRLNQMLGEFKISKRHTSNNEINNNEISNNEISNNEINNKKISNNKASNNEAIKKAESK